MVSKEMLELGKKSSVIREIFEYAKVRRTEIGAENVFDFSLGNPSIPAPAIVGETMQKLLAETDPVLLHGYTSAPGDMGVRQTIANHITERFGCEANPNLIYMTCGAAASLTVSLRALCSAGDEVILLAPFFPEYQVFVRNAGAVPVVVPGREGVFDIDFAALASAITSKTRAVIVNSPNNPSGVVLNEECIRRLADLLTEKSAEIGRPIAIIADEPYRELVYGDVEVPYIPCYYNNTLVCYSYSKSLSLPGERIGYILVPPMMEAAGDVFAAICGAGRSLGFVCAPSLLQLTVAACDGTPPDLSAYDDNRTLLYESLTKIGYEAIRPDGAFYLFVKALEPDATAFYEMAKKFELLLVPSDSFGVPGYVRIAYCVSNDQIRRSIPAFEALYKEYHKVIPMSELDIARETINEVDQEMARLFEQRMDAVRQVADYKKEHGIPVEDTAREDHIVRKNAAYIENEGYRSLYASFLRSIIELSKNYQHRLIDEARVSDRTFTVHTSNGSYAILIRRGLLSQAGDLFHLNRKVLVVTDSGVPEQYAMTVASQCAEAVVFVFEQGEASKNMDTLSGILQTLTENAFTRADCIVAVGGGVVGDMAGFAAATYMRGIDFYNIPTTVLSQVDSSVGGKTAIDFMGYKNLVGAFYPPKGVLIDPNVLSTLPKRHVSNGLAEAVKVGLTHDADLFALLEKEELTDAVMDEVIWRAIQVKIQVVEADEHESGQRKVLNFGHTLGHGIESVTKLLHGECVALGMLPMCTDEVRQRLRTVLERLELPTSVVCNADAVKQACRHDKKLSANMVTVVTVPQIGQYELKTIKVEEFEELVQEELGL